MARQLRLGTRGSQLALWQANAVATRIAETGGPRCAIVVIKTTGDRLQDAPLSEAGGKRLFVKEIEEALLRREIDLAVHSSKDMPVILPDGLAIGGVLPRDDPHDAVILPQAVASDLNRIRPGETPTIDDLVAILGQSPRIGTSSVRRIAQLTRILPGARFEPIRGNLDTRLRKLDEGGYDAIVLAAAGLRRLGVGHRIAMTLPPEACVPAPGQGIVAVEIRQDDAEARGAVEPISDAAAAAALDAERAVIDTLGGGCQTPIGVLATLEAQVTSHESPVASRESPVASRESPVASHEAPVASRESQVTSRESARSDLHVIAVVVALDGSRAVRAQARGDVANARLIGKAVGSQLLAEGAGDILAAAQSSGAIKPPVSSE